MIEALPPTELPAARTPPRRRGLRFSLVNLALVLTVAALGIGLYRAGKEVVPLRETVRRLREEMGYFQVDDESRIHVKQVATKLPSAWKWRMYMPAGRTYRLGCFCGNAPSPESVGRNEWFRLMRESNRGTTYGSDSVLDAGEFGFEALLTEYGGNWYLRWGRVQDDGVTITLPPSATWVDEETDWVLSSDVRMEQAESFAPQGNVVLLHLEPKPSRGVDAAVGSGAGADEARPRIVLWIEAEQPGPGAAGAASP